MSILRLAKNLFSPQRHFRISRQALHSSINCKSITFLRSSLTLETMATTDPVLPDSVPAPSAPSEPTLPRLTPHEFRIYNRMAEHMDYFHNHFRETWKVLYGACETGKRSKGMSIRQFISLGQQFCSQLEMHHGIEERYVNSVLSRFCCSEAAV